jgi:hypothetical protein
LESTFSLWANKISFSSTFLFLILFFSCLCGFHPLTIIASHRIALTLLRFLSSSYSYSLLAFPLDLYEKNLFNSLHHHIAVHFSRLKLKKA